MTDLRRITCPSCGRRFQQRQRTQVYDSTGCRLEAFKARQLQRIRAEVIAEMREKKIK